MKQTKWLQMNFNQPQKIISGIIFILAFLAFSWEVLSVFLENEPLKTVNKSTPINMNQMPVNSNSVLFTKALFGDYVPADLSDAEIKQSMLDVQVVGIMFSGKEGESQVIIRLANGEENDYFIGDTLPGGAVIKRISEKGVVILHNGTLERLSLPKNELIFNIPEKPLIEE